MTELSGLDNQWRVTKFMWKEIQDDEQVSEETYQSLIGM